MDMMELYQNNDDFKLYVDRYSRKYIEGKSITLTEAFEHKLVREVAMYILFKEGK